MQWLYLISLIVSIGGLGLIDRRYSLIFYRNKVAAVKLLVLLVGIFVIWDILGIGMGIFFSGESQYMSGIYIIKDFPLEELFFLVLLSYCPLIIYSFLEKARV